MSPLEVTARLWWGRVDSGVRSFALAAFGLFFQCGGRKLVRDVDGEKDIERGEIVVGSRFGTIVCDGRSDETEVILRRSLLTGFAPNQPPKRCSDVR